MNSYNPGGPRRIPGFQLLFGLDALAVDPQLVLASEFGSDAGERLFHCLAVFRPRKVGVGLVTESR